MNKEGRIQSFTDLIVWRKAHQLVLLIYKLLNGLITILKSKFFLAIFISLILNLPFVSFAAEPSKNFLAVGPVQILDSAGGLMSEENGYVLRRGSFGNEVLAKDLLTASEINATAPNLNVIEMVYTFIRGNPSRGGFLAVGEATAAGEGIFAAGRAYVFIQPGIEVVGDIYAKSPLAGGITMSGPQTVGVSGGAISINAPNKIPNYTIAQGSMMEWKSNLTLKNQMMKDNFDKLKKRAKDLTPKLSNSVLAESYFDLFDSATPADYPEGAAWYRQGDLTIGEVDRSEVNFKGRGTILVDGDLAINSDLISIPATGQSDSSLGFIVTGDIYIKDASDAVRDNNKTPGKPKQFQVIHGTYYAGRTIYAQAPASDKVGIPLYIFGSLTAESFDFSQRR